VLLVLRFVVQVTDPALIGEWRQITERVVAELSGSDAEVQARDYRHKPREGLRYAGSNAVYYVVTQQRPLDRPPLGEYGAADCEPLEED
jgi:hypothetical protein